MTQTTSEEIPMNNNNVAVELARFSGKLDQVIVDHGRRLTALENKGSKMAGMWSPIIAGIAVTIALADKVNWQ